MPLLSFHHLEELCAHADRDLVRRRVAFLSALPMLAWIGDDSRASGPGGIVTMLRAEAMAAYANLNASVEEIQKIAASTAIRYGSGGDFIGPQTELWVSLQQVFLKRSKSNRAFVAVARTNVIDISSKSMSELLKG